MSVVTNLILTMSTLDEDMLDQINAYPNEGKGFTIVSVRDSKLPRDWYGGSKRLETEVLIGAYNHFDLPPFVEYLKTLPWEHPEEVSLGIRQRAGAG